MTTDSFLKDVEECPGPKGKAAGFTSAADEVTPSEAKAVKRGRKPDDPAITHKNYTIRDVPVEWIKRIESMADENGLTMKDMGHALLFMAFKAYDEGVRPMVKERPRAKNIFAPET